MEHQTSRKKEKERTATRPCRSADRGIRGDEPRSWTEKGRRTKGITEERRLTANEMGSTGDDESQCIPLAISLPLQ